MAEFSKTEAQIFEKFMQSVNLTHFLKKTQRGTLTRFKLKQTFEPDLNDQVLKYMESFKYFKEEIKFKDFKECARVKLIPQVLEILTDSYDTLCYKFKERSLILWSYNQDRLKHLAA